MAEASEWLVELEAHTGSEVVSLRYSASGYVTGPDDDPANTVYGARLSSIGAFSRHLFGEGRTMGAVTVDLADATLANADGELDGLIYYGVAGRPFVLRRLASPASPFSTVQTVLTGTLEGIDASNGFQTLLVRFYDRRRDIDIPIQTDKYGGTTTESGPTADGSPDMAGELKPLVFGKCFSVPATIVNDFNLFLQFSASALASITLYDGGVPLINDGDVANLAALASATGNPGHYRTCLAQGIARPFGAFNGRPAFVWTADVVEGVSEAFRRPGAIVARMLAKIGETDIDAATFTALDALAPYETGIYIDRETSTLTAIRTVLDSVGGFIVPNPMGQFTVGRLDAPGVSVATISEPEILTSSSTETLPIVGNPDTDGGVPTHRLNLNWGRNWHVHSDSDLAGCANHGDPMRGAGLMKGWREATAEDPGVLTKHLLSKELTVDTLLVEQADAQAEATRRLGLYGVNRHVIRVGVERAGSDLMQPNATVTLDFDRYGYSGGKPMVIIGRSDDFQNEKAILTLWG